MEENVLKSIKNAMDIVCLHLSDQLFDLVLKLVYDYATTNAKSNAVRAFGQLVACLARVNPQKTLDKFLPFCIAQIQEEVKHGASSIRTTSTHNAVPSDTTLHWSTFDAFLIVSSNMISQTFQSFADVSVVQVSQYVALFCLRSLVFTSCLSASEVQTRTARLDVPAH